MLWCVIVSWSYHCLLCCRLVAALCLGNTDYGNCPPSCGIVSQTPPSSCGIVSQTPSPSCGIVSQTPPPSCGIVSQTPVQTVLGLLRSMHSVRRAGNQPPSDRRPAHVHMAHTNAQMWIYSFFTLIMCGTGYVWCVLQNLYVVKSFYVYAMLSSFLVMWFALWAGHDTALTYVVCFVQRVHLVSSLTWF